MTSGNESCDAPFEHFHSNAPQEDPTFRVIEHWGRQYIQADESKWREDDRVFLTITSKSVSK
jgi:hypothetical protein